MSRKKFSLVKTVILSVIAAAVGLVGGFIAPLFIAEDRFTANITTDELTEAHGYYYLGDISDSVISVDDADLSVHFIELGNKYTGDCTLIKVGNTEVLIDCGSREQSVPFVKSYLDNYVDGVLEYVIVTHAHQDHYAGFATAANKDSIFDLFDCGTVITFSNTNQKPTAKLYNNFKREIEEVKAKGTEVYDALSCVNNVGGAQDVYQLSDGVNLEILYHAFYEEGAHAESENDYSVCCMINCGEKKLLFTGDLEEDGEESLADNYKTKHGLNAGDFVEVELYKAGHHGSKTSSSEYFLSVFQPKICCVCCCAGSTEYTKNANNTFPTQTFINNISKYTDKVYVTTLCIDYEKGEFKSFNGNIVVALKDGAVSVNCSDNNEILKNTEWYKENRTSAYWDAA